MVKLDISTKLPTIPARYSVSYYAFALFQWRWWWNSIYIGSIKVDEHVGIGRVVSNDDISNNEVTGNKKEFAGKPLTPLMENADAARMKPNVIGFNNTIIAFQKLRSDNSN